MKIIGKDIGTLVVRFEGDLGPLMDALGMAKDVGIKAMNDLEKNMASKATQGASKAGNAGKKMGSDIASGANTATSALNGLQAMFKSLLAPIAAFLTATALIGAAKSAFIDYNSEMELTAISFETMLGSAEAAKDLMIDLKDFAANTPFDFPELSDASSKLLAMGFAAEDIIPVMTSVGNTAAATGKGSAGIEQITRALGDIKTKGTLATEEMKQLVNANIPAWDMLAKKTGQTVAEVKDQVSKGAISADDAIAAILEGMDEKFGGLMDKQSATLTGRLSNMADNVGQIFGSLGEGIFEKVSGGVGKVGDFLDKFSDNMKSGGLSQALEDLIPPVLMDKIYNLMGAFGNLFDTLGVGFDTLMANPWTEIIGDALLWLVGLVIDGASNLIDAITLISGAFFSVQDAVGNALAGMAGFVENHFGWLINKIKWLVNTISQTVPSWIKTHVFGIDEDSRSADVRGSLSEIGKQEASQQRYKGLGASEEEQKATGGGATKSGGSGGSGKSAYDQAKEDFKYFADVSAGEKMTAQERLEAFQKMVDGKAKSAKDLKDYETNLRKMQMEAEKEALDIEAAQITKEYNSRMITAEKRAEREISLLEKRIDKEKEGSLQRIKLESDLAAKQANLDDLRIQQADNTNRRLLEIERSRSSVEEELIRHKVAMGQMSEQEALRARHEISQQSYQIELNSINQKLELMRQANMTELEEYQDLLVKKQLLSEGMAVSEIKTMNQLQEMNSKWVLDLKGRMADALADFVDGSKDSIKSLGKALKKELMSDAFKMLLGGQPKQGGILSGLLGGGQNGGGKKNQQGGGGLFGNLLGGLLGGGGKGGQGGQGQGGGNPFSALLDSANQLNPALAGMTGVLGQNNELMGTGNMLMGLNNAITQIFGTATKPTEMATTTAATAATTTLTAAAIAAAVALQAMSFGGGGGFAFESGGVVPSAMGGMITGSSGYGARKNIPSILHPKEMVLPKHISEMMIDLAGRHRDSGGFSGSVDSGSVYVNMRDVKIANDMDINRVAKKLGQQIQNRRRGGKI